MENSLSLKVCLINGDGKIVCSQPINDFLRGPKNTDILNKYAGRKLFDILVDDLGVIRYENNKLVLATILQLNPHDTAMRLLGKIAEAVIVRRCSEDETINREWFSIARKQRARRDTARKFKALGTGLKKTKDIWPQHYSPSDPQRDIIWVDLENKTIANMAGSTKISGLEAGLQVKVSKNGHQYLLFDLCNARYEVPVVYFDLSDDFAAVASKLIEYRQKTNQSNVFIGQDFICAKAIDVSAFHEVVYYVELVDALLSRRLSPEDLVEEAKQYTSMMNAISAVGLEYYAIETEIER